MTEEEEEESCGEGTREMERWSEGGERRERLTYVDWRGRTV